MVTFRDKEITRDNVQQAIERFDMEYPDTNQFDDWLNKKTYKFALRYNEKYYPPKYLLSQLTGYSINEFSGGDQTNDVFRELEFEIVDKPTNEKKVRYWKIAPGRKAVHWGRCLQDKNIAVGWKELKDLTEAQKDYDLFEKLYLEAFAKESKSPGGKAKIAKKKRELWDFLSLNIGDIVIANKGISGIMGIGRVDHGGYKYMDEYEEFKHTMPMNWFDTNSRNIPEGAKELSSSWFGFTVRELDENDYKLIMDINEPVILSGPIALLKKKKQIILYGSPGTGKTYSTKKLAISILEGRDLEEKKYVDDETLTEPTMGEEHEAKKNELFKLLEQSALSYPDVLTKPQKSMIGYYTDSKNVNRKLGLVWLTFPNSSGAIMVHLRKGKNGKKYPEQQTRLLKNYRDNGWGGYPQFLVGTPEEAIIAKGLIDFAYHHF